MSALKLSRQIAAPPGQVFEYFTDFPNAAGRLTGVTRIEMLTQGPTRIGTRWRETRRIMKHEATETLEVIALDPPQSVTIGCTSCGVTYTSSFRFMPASAGTRVEFEMNSRPLTLTARLLAPLMNLMMGATMRKCLEQDLADMQRACEAERPYPAS